MKPIDASFFDGKRPWSRIKDRVLGTYLPPYLRKVQRLQPPIVIVDCFAGRGKFSDGTPGSPLIICQQIQQHAPNRATAYFVNKRPAHHEALAHTIKGFTDAGIAHPILGQSHTFLADLTDQLANHSLFVYLDPFGIKGCTFNATKQLLQRNPAASTELLMTISMPILHRLAARRRPPRRARSSRAFTHSLMTCSGTSPGATSWPTKDSRQQKKKNGSSAITANNSDSTPDTHATAPPETATMSASSTTSCSPHDTCTRSA